MSQLDFPLPYGYGWQYHWIVAIQSHMNPTLTKVMYGLTLLGVENFFLLVLPILFWSVNKKVGLRITYIFLVSMYVNSWLKDLFGVIRPIGMPGIRSLYTSTATGYSMPGGHAQGPMTFWILVYKWIRKPWVLVLSLLLVFAIGFSRLYLGLHWPMDLFAGWGLGLLFALVGWPMGKWWTYRNYAFKTKMSIAILLPLFLMLVHTGTTSAEYAALMLGVGAGALWEERWLHLELESAWYKRICSAIIGVAGMIAVQYLMKWSQDMTVFVIIRDILLGLWTTLGAPYVFMLCGLHRRGEVTRD
jgi:membrane-associated phospholipid phosphatase